MGEKKRGKRRGARVDDRFFKDENRRGKREENVTAIPTTTLYTSLVLQRRKEKEKGKLLGKGDEKGVGTKSPSLSFSRSRKGERKGRRKRL